MLVFHHTTVVDNKAVQNFSYITLLIYLERFQMVGLEDYLNDLGPNKHFNLGWNGDWWRPEATSEGIDLWLHPLEIVVVLTLFITTVVGAWTVTDWLPPLCPCCISRSSSEDSKPSESQSVFEHALSNSVPESSLWQSGRVDSCACILLRHRLSAVVLGCCSTIRQRHSVLWYCPTKPLTSAHDIMNCLA